MPRFALPCLALLTLASVTGCGRGVRPVGPPSGGRVTAPPAALHQAILQGLQDTRMQVVEDGPAGILAQHGSTRRGFRIRITPTSTGYEVTLVDSEGMRQRVDPATGQMVIHGRYHTLVDRLHDRVSRRLGSAGRASGAAGPEVRVIQTAGPVDAGLVQRGFLVAGLQVAEANAAAGFVRTQPQDTGFGYGFIEGEGATLHVAYVATTYPDRVQISQQVQRCARVIVAVGVGVAEELRCEPFTGRPPGQAAGQLDTVVANVQRELEAAGPAPATGTVTASATVSASVAAAPAGPAAVYGDDVFPVTCRGEVAPAVARAILGEAGASVRACYAAAREANPALRARVMVRLRVSTTGAVDAARLESSAPDPQLLGCLHGVVTAVRFPVIAGGECASISVPFNLHP